MSSSTLPTTPVDNWEKVRDEWIAAVGDFMDETETWAKRQGWGVLREPKVIKEDDIGTYSVPRMLLHDLFGRVVLDPVARFVMGAEGRIDIHVIPSWESLIIVRMPEGWDLIYDDAEGPRSRWSEEVMIKTVLEITQVPRR